MSTRRVLEAFERWRADRVPLVLVTVIETEGSTYTKAGHRILMTGGGEFQGLVSGGCLEGDLAAHAHAVLATGRPKLVTYDLREGEDELWGLGIGCNGVFRVLLQPLTPADDYEPFRTIAAVLAGHVAGVAAIVAASEDAQVPAGATLTIAGGTATAWRVPPQWEERLLAGCRQRLPEGGSAAVAEEHDGTTLRALYAPLRPLPWLLVLGAGLDAVPLVELARQLGWRVLVTDHRPAYLERGDLGLADAVREVLPAGISGALADGLRLDDVAAAIVMSHHLDSDREYLRVLAQSRVPYVGLLGPPARRDRLLADLGAAAAPLRPRLHAPAGLRIGADSPESIALAILAEIHTHRGEH